MSLTLLETRKTGFVATRPIFEPAHEILILITFVSNKASEEPACTLDYSVKVSLTRSSPTLSQGLSNCERCVFMAHQSKLHKQLTLDFSVKVCQI